MFRLVMLVLSLAAAGAIAYYEIKGESQGKSRPKEIIDRTQQQADKIQADMQKRADDAVKRSEE